MKQMIALLSAAAALSGCSDSSSSYDDGYARASASPYENSFRASEDREPFDEDAAREAAERDLASEGYDYSYGCTDDCSGHEAGWQWRAENGYSTYGNSESFAEGGYAFDEALESRVEEMRDDYEAGLDPDY
ncbi:MAG: hypothetical protein HXY28_03985 [Hydrogenophilaceae bacterium]|jgi:hypothetical protein|nr:hypothetical protein [Hydrogenophilaceae bacterium]